MRDGSHDAPDDLLRLFQRARTVPERNRTAATLGRQRLLAEVRALAEDRPRGALVRWLAGWGGVVRQRTGRLVVAATALLLLAGGTSGLVSATHRALPGDTLYPLKLAAEDATVTLAPRMESRLSLRHTFADRRLTEIEALLNLERYDDVALAAAEFEEQVRLGGTVLDTLQEHAPQAAQEAARSARSRSAHQQDMLADIITRAPEAARPGLSRALEASEQPQGHGRPGAPGADHCQDQEHSNGADSPGPAAPAPGHAEPRPRETEQPGAHGQPPGRQEPSDEQPSPGRQDDEPPPGWEKRTRTPPGEEGDPSAAGIEATPTE